MIKPKQCLRYVWPRLDGAQEDYPNKDKQILKSALVYQCLAYVYLNKVLSLEDKLNENHGKIGLIGPFIAAI